VTKVVSFQFNCKNKSLISLKYHLKGSKLIFVQEAKIQLMEKPLCVALVDLGIRSRCGALALAIFQNDD
jgi:hypothetical protein